MKAWRWSCWCWSDSLSPWNLLRTRRFVFSLRVRAVALRLSQRTLLFLSFALCLQDKFHKFTSRNERGSIKNLCNIGNFTFRNKDWLVKVKEDAQGMNFLRKSGSRRCWRRKSFIYRFMEIEEYPKPHQWLMVLSDFVPSSSKRNLIVLKCTHSNQRRKTSYRTVIEWSDKFPRRVEKKPINKPIVIANKFRKRC